MLLNGDIGLCKAATPPLDFTTANVGGVISTGPVYITGSTIGEQFFSIDPNAAGGSSLIQTVKDFIINISTTNTAKSCKIWFHNLIDDAPSLNTVSFVSDSASDNSSMFMRVIGFDNAGNPVQADINLNGTTQVTTGQTFLHISRIEFRLNSSGALAPLNGNGTIKSGSTVLGTAPYGKRGVSTEWKMLMESTLNSNTTIATTAANPTGTFFTPRTAATGLAFSGNLSHIGGPNAQGFWVRQTIPAATIGSEEIDFAIRFSCRV